jgi:3-oxoacyl-[acyl-carrier-protein] synthase-3
MTSSRFPRPAGVRLAGTGMAVPRRLLTNVDLSRFVDTSDEWITQRTGIKQRYVLDENQTMRDLAREATRQAMDNAGIAPGDLDLLICATMTPEMNCPATACRIVAELGATPAGAMDISIACSGFVYGLNMADGLVRSGMYKHVAVVGVEAFSTILDWKDRSTCVLFGDGAGAAILSAGDDPDQGSLYHTMNSDGSQWDSLYCPTKEHQISKTNEYNGRLGTLQMNGREVYKFAVATLMKTIRTTLKANNLEPNDVSVIIPHQSNARILESARDKLGLTTDQLYINIDRYANTSAASVPICLHELVDSGRLKRGDLVLLVALGGGMSWASNLWRL